MCKPRKVFANPNNHKECSKLFGKILAEATGEKIQGFWGGLINLFSSMPKKTAHLLESASFIHTTHMMKKQKINYSLNWVAQNTGLPIKDVLDKDFMSFYVFTKEHRSGFIQASVKNMKNIMKYLKESTQKYPDDSKMGCVYSQAKLGV